VPRTAPAPNMIAAPGMNPGNIVAGGGGGAGGGSGKGGKGGKGGQGEDEDAEGGGKGAGKCGSGDKGSCSNCTSDFSAGDPVAVVDGRTFTIPKTDLLLPGAFKLDFRRSYSSDLRSRDKGMGWGWTHSLAWTLEEKRRNLVLNAGDGRQVELPKLKVGEAARNDNWAVKREGPGYVVRPGNDFVHYFARTDDTETYRLVHVICRNIGQLNLYYEQGRLVRVLDTVGREVHLAHNAEGRLANVSVPSPNGQSIVFASYDYDVNGNLRAVTDADGHVTYYEYDDNHRLTRLTYPSSLTFHFVYDKQGRCKETWGAYPDGRDPALADSVPKELADGSKAKGILHCKFEFEDGYTELSNSICLQRFFAGEDGEVGKAVDGTGAVTEREYDERGRVSALIDPTEARWETRYNDNGDVVEEVDPLGSTVQFERDVAGRVLSVTDPLGHRTQMWRDGFGEVVTIQTANGSVQHFTLGANSRVAQRVDARGATHRYEYDGHANLIAYTSPGGRKYQFEYDYWGRMLSESDPLGHGYHYQYSNSGLPANVTDPLGRVVHFFFDNMGNLVQRVNPDGGVETWQYGGLDWLYCMTHADGSQVQRRYNREGWLLTVQNERQEVHKYEYQSNGLLEAERDTFGRRTEYERDALGRLISWDEGRGKHSMELDATGQVLARVAPDDTRHDFEYSSRGELVRAKSANVEFVWRHDPFGAIVEEKLLIEGQEYRIDTEYDATGERIATKTSLGLDLKTPRSIEGQIERVVSPENVILGIERDATGLPVRKALPGGAVIVEEYDAGLHLKSRSVKVPSGGTTGAEPGWVGRAADGIERSFDYSPAGEMIRAESSDGHVLSLQYDLRRHIKSAEGAFGDLKFAVDGAGNYYESGENDPRRTYGKGNQIEKCGPEVFVHDDRGFIIERLVEQGGGTPPLVTRYEWDAEGMLSAAELPDGSRVEYIYDAFARRMGRRLLREGKVIRSEHFIWDRVSMVHAAEVDVHGKLRDLSTYLYLENWDETPIGQRHGDFQTSQAWNYYLAGVTLAPERIIDGAGRTLGRLSSNVFGKAELVEGTVSTPFRHPGQQADPDTGLHYNRYRYYDPNLGRYLSPDPIGVAGGLNLYSYGPNPIGWIDPMGWKHFAYLITDVAMGGGIHSFSGDPNLVISGSADRYLCPDSLKSQPKCHTEQKVCHDLLAQKNGDKDALKGKKVTMLGEKPPCPRCHSAMMRTSQHTGADIKYKWKDEKGDHQTITYKGGTGKPTAPDDKKGGNKNAKELLGGYHDESSLKDDWKFHGSDSSKGIPAHDLWGADPKREDGKKPDLSKNYQSVGSDKRTEKSGADYWTEEEVVDEGGTLGTRPNRNPPKESPAKKPKREN